MYLGPQSDYKAMTNSSCYLTLLYVIVKSFEFLYTAHYCKYSNKAISWVKQTNVFFVISFEVIKEGDIEIVMNVSLSTN